MSIDLGNLPDITFAEKSAEQMVSEMISDFEQSAGRTLQRIDPLRIFLLSVAGLIIQQRNLIDFSAKQNLLKYSSGDYIENIAALYGVSRLQPSYACTTLKFTISKEHETAVLIPGGIRVTAGDGVYFETLEGVEIRAGETYASVNAVCTSQGSVGNGYLPGQINLLVDPFMYFKSVENTTVSQGGADLEDLESLRDRIRQAPEAFSSAGPYGAYKFWTKTANQLIEDVSVTSPNPAEVLIIPLLKNGELPTDDILDAVLQECSDDTRRPLTDKVKVARPVVISYSINVKYYISRENSASGLTIKSNVYKAAKDFAVWQRSRLGRDINPSELTRRIMEAGAKRVEVIEPQFHRTNFNEVAVAEDIDDSKVIFGGLEDE